MTHTTTQKHIFKMISVISIFTANYPTAGVSVKLDPDVALSMQRNDVASPHMLLPITC